MDTLTFSITTPLGPLAITTKGPFLSSAVFSSTPLPPPQCELSDLIENAFFLYFTEKKRTFSIPILLEGTSFQKSVWNALLKVPFNKTQSYLDIAHAIKNPKAVRAVATAIGKNPISIIVPCHRIIYSSGGLGGYAFGLDKKLWLLTHEQEGVLS